MTKRSSKTTFNGLTFRPSEWTRCDNYLEKDGYRAYPLNDKEKTWSLTTPGGHAYIFVGDVILVSMESNGVEIPICIRMEAHKARQYFQ